jgi:hypothetical protein
VNKYKLLVSFMFLSFSLYACFAKVTENNDCESWLENAVMSVEEVTSDKRFKMALKQIALSCNNIASEKIRSDVNKSILLSVEDRQLILQKTVASYYSDSCLDTKATEPASHLIYVCLGEDFPNGPMASMLSSIDAASYMLGKVIEKRLKASNLSEFHSRKFMLNYYMGAAVDMEGRSIRLQ